MKRISVMAFILMACQTFAQQKLNNSAFMHAPESVATDNNNYYIADIGEGGNPTKKDGNGSIFRMDKKGNGSILAKGLDAPKGAFILHHMLFVADIDKVKGYDIATGAQLYNIDFAPATAFLNDIAAINDTTLVVSATDVNKLFLVHLSKHPRVKELVYTNPIKGTNGVVYDAHTKKLYVCGFGGDNKPDGQIGYIDMAATEKVFKPLTSRPGYYDGIALTAHNTQLIISDWVAFEKKGILLKLDLASGKVTTLNEEPVAGPADFTLDAAGAAIVPAMLEGNILRYNISK
ncbi:hypothetical protein SAMN05660461_3059 [Chitinophaga ginsengisegetis]|uniref:SMP-30/Gluconolaconase/LRE-like region-containing protein n=1 Tax=Chitinophaga ginsengisegetis TaxID=393003 RepID=A0A1T5NXW5_9BACT|nr:hypothetical protein [Chitinophaga ginsengisegetis]SKD05310.1 hypothetical protein SAMN05660461_3059 [Chitinophaga ginsengisegetis]